MKVLKIKLKKKDIHSIHHVLQEIADMIEEGYHRGIDCPVNWSISKTKKLNTTLTSLQEQVRDLRDSDGHFCPAVENEDEQCACGRYDAIIDTLENMKYNE